MLSLVHALGPVFMVILIGALLKKIRFPSIEFWPQLERLVYYFLFPAMLATRLALADFSGVAVGRVLLAVFLLLIAMTLLLVILRRFISRSGPEFTSIYQGGIRFNTYVAIAASAELFGGLGLALAAVIMAVMIPLLNILCVFIFSLYAGEERMNARRTFITVIKNPLILGCLLGIFLNITGIGMPGWTQPVMEIISRAALPLGLLAVGVALNLEALRSASKALFYSNLAKLLIMPLVAVGISLLLKLEVQEQAMLVLFAAMPTATSAYILARQLGGDAPLMAAIVTAQTLVAMVTLPLVIYLNQLAFGLV
ncbi:MAG TPA: AEC family transporter [Marinospirillum sp.]|uniref:AEC family transporter n=1 Tax=Marinospirillum sp. TaxID=2183934 RepID=UPI002B4A47D1|nr:AEC family transporter [Marinospirillum sp.]HKM15196.1 AEC family transporter [Marinospirillum sp.]